MRAFDCMALASAAGVPRAILAAYIVKLSTCGADERVWCDRARAAKNFVSALAVSRGAIRERLADGRLLVDGSRGPRQREALISQSRTAAGTAGRREPEESSLAPGSGLRSIDVVAINVTTPSP